MDFKIRKILKNNDFSILMIIAWIVFAVYLSSIRSLWCDEFIRFEQTHLSLKDALKFLFHEVSPFAPGEIFLNHLSKLLFSKFLPLEIWGRFPGIIWGILTLLVLRKIEQIPNKNFLVLLGIVSVSFNTLMLNMRPYGSLIFAGTLSLKLILDFEKNKKMPHSEAAFLWFGIIFSHLYGICFLGMASFFRKKYKAVLFAVIYVVLILKQYPKTTFSNNGHSFSPLADLMKVSAGFLSNPQMFSTLYFPLALIGIYFLIKKLGFNTFYKIALLSIATVLMPVFATYRSGYFYQPRQIAAGLPIVWFLTSLGATALIPSIRKILFPVFLIPFFCAFFLKMPPYTDQPIHQFKQILKTIESDNTIKRVLIADNWNRVPFLHYANQQFKQDPPYTKEIFEKKGRSTEVCFSNQKCIVFLIRPLEEIPRETFYQPYDLALYSSLEPLSQLNCLRYRCQRTW